jgi:hypothetical protein
MTSPCSTKSLHLGLTEEDTIVEARLPDDLLRVLAGTVSPSGSYGGIPSDATKVVSGQAGQGPTAKPRKGNTAASGSSK